MNDNENGRAASARSARAQERVERLKTEYEQVDCGAPGTGVPGSVPPGRACRSVLEPGWDEGLPELVDAPAPLTPPLFDEQGRFLHKLPEACWRTCAVLGDPVKTLAYWQQKLGFEVPRERAVRWLMDGRGGTPGKFDSKSDAEIAREVLYFAAWEMYEAGKWAGLVTAGAEPVDALPDTRTLTEREADHRESQGGQIVPKRLAHLYEADAAETFAARSEPVDALTQPPDLADICGARDGRVCADCGYEMRRSDIEYGYKVPGGYRHRCYDCHSEDGGCGGAGGAR